MAERPNKAWVILLLITTCLCVLGATCGTLGYLGFKASSRQDDQAGAQGADRPDVDQPGPSPGGGTLRLVGGIPPTLDPAVVQDSTSAEYVVHLFSGLVALNAELEVVPDLASRWDVSQDGCTYTFHLEPGATFADGRPIVARDFVYSIERALSPELASPVAESYLGDIVGAREFRAGRAERISGLRAASDHVLEVEIDAPKAYFLAKLTYPTAFVVDQAQIEAEGQDWLRRPSGTGPFALESLTSERIVLVRNERYVGQPPALERLEYHLGSGTPITMYENDQIDIVELPPSEIERVTDPHNPLRLEHHLASELSVFYLGLNVSAPPFDDLPVRQAFAQAIDKAKIADLVLKGTATPARGILPPAMPDFDETLEGLAYDPEHARRLLAASRYAGPGNMPSIVLAVSGTSGHMPPVTRAILSMIEENLGIEMTVEQVEWSYFLRDLNERRYQMYQTGWIADYPHSQNFLDVLFHSQSSQNHSGYANAPVDELLERARLERDPAKRTQLYRQAERIIVAEAAWVPLTHGIVHTLVKPYVKGFSASSAIHPWLRDIRLEKQDRARDVSLWKGDFVHGIFVAG